MGRLRKRLGWKMGLLLSAVLLLVMVFLSVGDYLWQQRVFLGELTDHIAEEAWTVAILLQDSSDSAERQRLLTKVVRALDEGEQHGRHHEVFILDHRGVVQASNMETLLGHPMDSEPVLRVLRDETTFASGVMPHGDHASFYGVVPLHAGQDPSSPLIGAVHIAEPLQPIQAHLGQFLTQRLLFLALVTGVLIVVLNLLINQTVSTPLKNLAGTMEQVHHGNLDTRVQVNSADELGQIGQAFNSMIQAVQESQQTIEQKRNRLALLYDINRRLANAVDWDEVVDLLVRIPGEIVDVAGCFFVSFDERAERLTLEGAWGLDKDDLASLELYLQQLKDPLRCLNCQPRIARVGTSCPFLRPRLTERAGIRSILCLHLAQGEQTVGFLHVCLPTKAPPPPAKVQLLNVIAGEMAAVVAAAQLRARELAMLSNLDRTIRTQLDLHEMLEQLLKQTREASRVAQGALFLYDGEAEKLQPVAFQDIAPQRLDDLQALALRAISRREPLLVSQSASRSYRQWAKNGLGSVLAIPLVLEEDVLGAFLLADRRPDAFSQRQVTLLSAIASQAALIVRNSQLYARLRGQAILEERNRLAREIHDGLVQTLGYLKLQVARMQGWAQDGDLERLRVEVTDLRKVLEDAYAEARDAIAGLRVGISSEDTLESILAEHVQSFSARYGLPTELEVEGKGLRLQPAAILHLLRIVQEGLTNIRKHAQASRVWVKLVYTSDEFVLTISDNGQGLDSQGTQPVEARGLQFMQERAESLGGWLTIHPRDPQGTEIQVTIPTGRKSGRETSPTPLFLSSAAPQRNVR